jgi:hypothetical protein
MLDVVCHNEPLVVFVPIVDYSKEAASSNNNDETTDDNNSDLEATVSVTDLIVEASENENLVTALLVKYKEPTKIYFVNHVVGFVVKVFDIKEVVAHIIIPDNFKKSKQVFVITYKNAKQSVYSSYVLKLNVSNSNVSVRKKESNFESEKSGPFEKLKELLKNPNSSFSKYHRVAFTSSTWSQFQGNAHSVDAVSRMINTLTIDYDIVAGAGSVLMLRKFKPGYRNSQAVGPTGLIEYSDEISDSVRLYSCSSYVSKAKAYKGVPAVLLGISKIMFFDRKPTVRTHRFSPHVFFTFSNSDITNFCFNENKLFVCIDHKQIYVYSNFEAFYSSCYHRAADSFDQSLFDNKENIKLKTNDEELIKYFSGNLDAAMDFSLPEPDRVIEVIEDSMIGNMYCFCSNVNEIFAYTTSNGGLNESITVMNGDQVIYKQEIRGSVKDLSCVPSKLEEANRNTRSLSRRRYSEFMLTLETNEGTVIRTTLRPRELAVTSATATVRNLSAERFESRSGQTNISRFLDI